MKVRPMSAIANGRSLFRGARADRKDPPLVIIISQCNVEFAQLALAFDLDSPLPSEDAGHIGLRLLKLFVPIGTLSEEFRSDSLEDLPQHSRRILIAPDVTF